MKRKKSFLPIITIMISCLVLVVAILNYRLNKQTTVNKTRKTVIIEQGVPIQTIPEGQSKFDLKVRNTSEVDIQYYIETDTNIGSIYSNSSEAKMFVDGHDTTKPKTVGKVSSNEGSSSIHTYNINATYKQPSDYSIGSTQSPVYYLSIDIIDNNTKKVILHNSCQYRFDSENKEYILYKTSFDTEETEKALQDLCYI